MSKKDLQVQENMVVSLEYILTLEDGEEIDRADRGEPLEYLHGHNNIIPGLETALLGLAVGDEKVVVVEPEDGYGVYNPDNFEAMPLDAFPPELKLEEGLGLQLRDGRTGELFQAFVSEVSAEEVVLDFNHPLAGEKLNFAVRVAGVRPATTEELAHGHVHGAGHHH